MSARSDRPRDPRLDVLRGAGLIIIFIAHTAHNSWGELIPARFGFSDATEIFVFCSGVASALAFGGAFRRAGVLAGTARVAQRIWQVYWAHLASWIAIVSLMLAADATFGGSRYADALGLPAFLADPARGLIGLVTLTYVPTYFDILPMYLIMLAMIPLMIGLSQISRLAPLALSAAIWAFATLGWMNLPADPWTGSPWLFNPFSWQVLFFAGFTFGMGWLAVPADRRALRIAALVLLALTVPLAWHHIYMAVPAFGAAREALGSLIEKTNLGALRLIHFFALAYLAYHLAGEGGRRLTSPALEPLRIVGQQALAVFLAGMMLAQVCGIFLDRFGAGAMNVLAANLVGFGGLILTACLVRWFKSAPWASRKELAKPESARFPQAYIRPAR